MILVTGKCNKKAHQDSINNKRVKIFSREEISFFLHTAKTQGMNNDFEIFSLLMNTGMRVGELCALQEHALLKKRKWLLH